MALRKADRRRVISMTTSNVVFHAFHGIVPRVTDPMDGGRITAAGVLSRPGWTPAKLTRYLGYPDEICRCDAIELRLYSLARILAAEGLWQQADLP